MKRTFKIALVVILLVMGLVLLTGCGDKEEKGSKKQDLSKFAGTYTGKYTKLVGDETKNEEVFSVTLEKDGTGTSHREDTDYKMTWKLDGEKFSMTEKFMGITIDYTGTLKDGKLDIFNGDPEDIWTYEYVYEKAE